MRSVQCDWCKREKRDDIGMDQFALIHIVDTSDGESRSELLRIDLCSDQCLKALMGRIKDWTINAPTQAEEKP